MRGASALQSVIDGAGLPAMRVFVVWEPVILTDLAPPTSAVLARLSDSRGSQYYDRDRLLSTLIQSSLPVADRDPRGEKGIVWDAVLIYPPGTLWDDSLPPPDFADGPVAAVIDRVRERLVSYRRAPQATDPPPSPAQKE